MKKAIIPITVILLSVSLFGCGTESKNPAEPSGSEQAALNFTDAPDGPVKVIGFDWPYYENAEEIISASSNVYTGVVTDISFEIINERTGEVDRSPDPDEPRALYTVYTVSTVDHYKGNQAETHMIRVTGGPQGYREDEQNDLLVSAGLVEPGGSIVYTGARTDALEIGKEYLFCTVSFDIVPDAEYEINPSQFALEPASDEAKSIVKSFK